MTKQLLWPLLTLLLAQPMLAQQNNSQHCWSVTPERDKYYFNLLFSGAGGHAANHALVKVDFEGGTHCFLFDIQVLRSYCKYKFNVADSMERRCAQRFLLDAKTIPLADTAWLKTIYGDDGQFRSSFIADTSLDVYRRMGVRNFMLRHCRGVRIKMPIYTALLAYLYESRVLWDNLTGDISQLALWNIEKTCGIKWDEQGQRWIDLNGLTAQGKKPKTSSRRKILKIQ